MLYYTFFKKVNQFEPFFIFSNHCIKHYIEHCIQHCIEHCWKNYQEIILKAVEK